MNIAMNAESLFRTLEMFRHEGMDLSIMEIRVIHKAEDIDDDIDEPLNGAATISVAEDGLTGKFEFYF